ALINTYAMDVLETKVFQHRLEYERILPTDQENAHDRVQPDYPAQILSHFELPSQLAISIMNLFFFIQISINVNDFLTKSDE
ncbi:hypothetical protein CU097_001672, partial [Rhizopus azygosporus]